MAQVADRKKRRRAYLRRQGKEYVVVSVLGTSLIPAVIGLMICLAAPFMTYQWLASVDLDWFWALLFVSVFGALYFGRLIWLSGSGIQQSIQRVKE